jgi:hypothetical protein
VRGLFFRFWWGSVRVTWWPNVFRDETVTKKKVPEQVNVFIGGVEVSTVLLKPTIMFLQF